jgi:hypothetical protein
METLKKVIYTGLFLILSNIACFSQNPANNDSLSFKRGSFSNQYYIGNRQVSYDDFIKNLGNTGEQAVKMFKTGRTVSIAGIVIGCVGAYGVGYDLGGRLAGGKGNSALLAGGGVVLVGGIIMSVVGENKMKKALKLHNGNSTSFFISPAKTGLGLCLNF